MGNLGSTMFRLATEEDAAQIAAVHVETWRSAYAGILPQAYLASLSIDERTTYWGGFLAKESRPSVVLVAERADAVIGFGCVGPERTGDPEYRGEIYALYVLPQHQSQGFGYGLFMAAVDCLLWSGYPSLLVWVLADNPARGFYEKLGGRLLRTRPIEVGGVPLAEVAYGWRSLATSLSRA